MAQTVSGPISLLCCQESLLRTKGNTTQVQLQVLSQESTLAAAHSFKWCSQMQKLMQNLWGMKSWSQQQIKQYLPIVKTFQRLPGSSICRLKPKCKRECDVCNLTKEMQQQKQEKEPFPHLVYKNMPVLGQADSCMRGDSLDTAWWGGQGGHSVKNICTKIF